MIDFASLSAVAFALRRLLRKVYTLLRIFLRYTRSLQTSFVLATNVEKRTYVVRANKRKKCLERDVSRNTERALGEIYATKYSIRNERSLREARACESFSYNQHERTSAEKLNNLRAAISADGACATIGAEKLLYSRLCITSLVRSLIRLSITNTY